MTKIHYNEKYLERRFKDQTLVELRLYLAELELKNKEKTITSEEALCIQPVREEIQRREKLKGTNQISSFFIY